MTHSFSAPPKDRRGGTVASFIVLPLLLPVSTKNTQSIGTGLLEDIDLRLRLK